MGRTYGKLELSSEVLVGSIILSGGSYYEVQAVCLGGAGEVSYLSLRPIHGELMPVRIHAGSNNNLHRSEAYFTVPYSFCVGADWWQSSTVLAAQNAEALRAISSVMGRTLVGGIKDSQAMSMSVGISVEEGKRRD